MHTKSTLRTLAVSALLLSNINHQLSTAYAQGTAFSYQGRLNDGANPANGHYDLTFALFNAVSGPSQAGTTLTNVATDVTNGLFSVTLDFGANFPGDDRWLELAVRTNGASDFTVLTPRQKITAVPYAITAGNVSGSVAAGQLTGAIAPANIGAGSITSTMLAAGSVTSNQLAASAVTLDRLATTVTNSLLTTFNNPSLSPDDNFGKAVAAVGTDKVLIGVPQEDDNGGKTNSGRAYLFSTSGALLTTFTNPVPGTNFYFGSAVAAAGTDKVIIGAYKVFPTFPAGRAYLFNINGALITTITNPTFGTAEESFGDSFAMLGEDKVLIGDWRESSVGTAPGGAFLFSTNGTLLHTFLNPTPLTAEFFGRDLAAVGADKVLIGSPQDFNGVTSAGAVYLYSTNGTLLTTITNPTPANFDNFGANLAVVGTDKVLIGANKDDTGATDAGVAYLYNTNGTLLTTFTNPTPTAGDNFGSDVAAVGTDRVLIGADFEQSKGAAYLFSIDGTLLATFSNPGTGSGTNNFGNSVAAVGTNKFLIGALTDGTGAAGAGSAYLFSLQNYMPGLISEGVLGGQSSFPSAGNFVFAYETNGLTVASANTFQDIPFGTDAQLNGWTHTATTASFTSVRSGLYLIQYTAGAETTSAGSTIVSIRAVLNGTEIAGSQVSADLDVSNQTYPISKSFIASIAAADVLKLQFTGTSTNNRLAANNGSGTTRPSVSLTIVRLQ